MKHFPQSKLTVEQQYKFLSGSVVPRPIAWITTLAPTGEVVNLAPFSFFSVVSKELPLVSVSILRKAGELKDTAYNILQTKEAVIHIVDQSLITEMNLSASSLPPEESELSLVDLELVPSQTVTVPSLKKPKIRFESRLFQHVEIKDPSQDKIISDLFILEVTDFFFAEAVFDEEKEYLKLAELNPISRLAGPNYASLGETIKLGRPE